MCIRDSFWGVHHFRLEACPKLLTQLILALTQCLLKLGNGDLRIADAGQVTPCTGVSDVGIHAKKCEWQSDQRKKDLNDFLVVAYRVEMCIRDSYNTMGLAKASLEAATRYLAFCLGPQGIRANAISAGPIKTLAASGIGNFGKLLAYNSHNAPLRRNVTIDEVGNAAAFMLSDLASAITGEIMYVDGGLNTTALGNADPLP